MSKRSMKILHARTLPEPCVLTIGKFESIHRGHRALIDTVVQKAAKLGVASAVVAFSPHPRIALSGDAYKPLFTQTERAFLLAQTGADYLLTYPFDEKLTATPAEDFVRILNNDLQARAIVVGEGFRFGHGREGTVEMLRTLAEKGVPTANAQASPDVIVCPATYNTTAQDSATPVSTSAIRALLSSPTPQLKKARALLGFPFFICGTVTRGRRLGHELGFPTLNIYPPTEKFLPPHGVYTTRTHLCGRVYEGITNIGTRPTVNNDGNAPTVETHLFNFSDDAYGDDIRVELLDFIRPEQRFDSLEALKRQINNDLNHFLF